MQRGGLGKSPPFSLVFFFLKRPFLDLRVPEKVFSSQRSRSSAGRFREGWTPTFLANLAPAPREYMSILVGSTPPPTRGFQLVANKDLGRDSRTYNFMSFILVFFRASISGWGGIVPKYITPNFQDPPPDHRECGKLVTLRIWSGAIS